MVVSACDHGQNEDEFVEIDGNLKSILSWDPRQFNFIVGFEAIELSVLRIRRTYFCQFVAGDRETKLIYATCFKYREAREAFIWNASRPLPHT